MAYKEWLEPIDESISICCCIMWMRGVVNCKCVFALHARHVILFSALWTGGIVFLGSGYRFWPVRTNNNLLLIVRVGSYSPPPPLKPKRQLAVTPLFSAAPPQVAQEVVARPIESDGEDEVAANDPETPRDPEVPATERVRG